MDERSKDIVGDAPVETENGIRPEDGEQSVSQDANADYSEGGDD